MSDIVERLCAVARGIRELGGAPISAIYIDEAAAEIERLRAELALYKQNYARKQLTDSERRTLEQRK